MKDKIKILVIAIIISFVVLIRSYARCVNKEEFEEQGNNFDYVTRCLIRTVVEELWQKNSNEKQSMERLLREKMTAFLTMLYEDDFEESAMPSVSETIDFMLEYENHLTEKRKSSRFDCAGFVTGAEAYQHLIAIIDNAILFCEGEKSVFLELLAKEPKREIKYNIPYEAGHLST